MKVLHVSPMPFGRGGLFGGGERYALELARHMADVVPTRLVSFAEEAYRDRVGNLDVHVLGRPYYVRGQRINPLHPGIVRHVAWANTVHCHQRFIMTSTTTAMLSRAAGRSVFVSDLGGGGWDITHRLPVVGRLYNGFLHISAFSRQNSGQQNEARARVIYGGVDVHKFSPDPLVPREKLVVFVGRLMPHKGINDLIEALPEGLRLEIIGRPYDERFHNDLRRLATGKHVVFRSDCTDRDIVQAYRRAQAIVLPSVYRDMYGNETSVPELLGQTLLEGMACGTPGICTQVASMPEIVRDGINGFVVPPNNPEALKKRLQQIRDEAPMVEAMGLAARQTVLEHFHWPAVVRTCLTAYGGSR